MTEKEIIQAFTEKMYEKIEKRHGRYQPFAWKDMDIKRLLMLLKAEIIELEQAYAEIPGKNPVNNWKGENEYKMKLEDIRDEAIDVANYAMFIYEMAKEVI